MRVNEKEKRKKRECIVSEGERERERQGGRRECIESERVVEER